MGWFGGYVLQTVNKVPGNYEVLTVGTTTVSLSKSKITPSSGSFAGMSAQMALVSLEGGNIRFRVDGQALPTQTNGHLLTDGDTLVLAGSQALNQFRAVRAGDTNGTLRVTFFY
jgi:hypothetical protein